MPELPKTRIPPNASAEAAAAWAENPLTRAYKLARLDKAEAEKWIRTLVGSGSVGELRLAIERGVDPVPIIVDRGELTNGWVEIVAKPWLRTKWSILFPILRNSARVRELVRVNDPAKGALLDTAAGAAWLDWTLWRATSFLAWYADVKIDVVDKASGTHRIVACSTWLKPPPGDCPLHLAAYPMIGGAKG